MLQLGKYTELREFAEDELTPREAIIAKCAECCCFDIPEAHRCDNKECALYWFNKKWMPSRTKVVSDEQKSEMVERLSAYRRQNQS